MDWKPLVKNVVLAFVAAFVTSLAIALEAYNGEPVKAFGVAALGAAIWAGVRAATALVKVALTDTPFKIDTEAS